MISQKKFYGEIEGRKLREFKNLNYNKKTLAERKKFIEELLEDKEKKIKFFEFYFDNYFNCNLSSEDELSEKNDVCLTLEKMANYLLGANEIREERKMKALNERFYIDIVEFKQRTKKEESLENKIFRNSNSKIKNDDGTGRINYLLEKNNYNKKEKKQQIFDIDFQQDNYCSSVLKDYQKMLDKINYELEKIKLNKDNKLVGKRYVLTKQKKELIEDMILCKNNLKGTFGLILTKDIINNKKQSLDLFQWDNFNHLKALIAINKKFDPDNEISILVKDLNKILDELIKNNILSVEEVFIIKMIRKGYKKKEIAVLLKTYPTKITRIMEKIINKIIKYIRKSELYKK
ncbi:MAG: hypothetical protein ACRDDY_02095 [Clostridium sp.]|uniref:hypothetical protein n=1 Tax=Clostridium sp. TaxID=1506 RepID=UPI003EE60FB0